MSKIKNFVVLLAVIATGRGLFSIFSVDSNNSKIKFSPELSQPQQQTKSEPPAEVQHAPAPTGQDPFKKFLAEKAGNAKLAAKSDSTQSLPVQPGKDPFKEFLEKQKQTSKDQIVSPFGKN